MIVVDASLAAAWCLREPEGIAIADRMIERMRTETAVVPGIFWHEMRNVLVIAERRKRIEAEAAEAHLGRLRNLRFVTDDRQDDREILVLARRHGLTAYDAAYVGRRNAGGQGSWVSTGSWRVRRPGKGLHRSTATTSSRPASRRPRCRRLSGTGGSLPRRSAGWYRRACGGI